MNYRYGIHDFPAVRVTNPDKFQYDYHFLNIL